MTKKHHRIAPDVKTAIIRRIKEEGTPVAQTATEHGIHETTIYGWLGTGANGTPSWSEFAKLKKERDELLRLVGELTVRLSAAPNKS